MTPLRLALPLVLASTASAQECLTWRVRSVSGPVTRFQHAMVYDTSRGRVLLFGGGNMNQSNYGGDHEWNGVAWSFTYTPPMPDGRRFPSMAYDSARGVVVLYGGFQADCCFDFQDTWERSAGLWTLRSATNPPGIRYGHAMAFDSARGVTVLYGGGSGPAASETWEWNGQAWSLRATAGPGRRFAAAMAYDSGRGVTVLFGGLGPSAPSAETWEWDGAAWTLRAAAGPAPRAGAALAYHEAAHRTVLFGGGDFLQPLGDTWTWDGQQWSPLPTPVAPRAQSYVSMAYDPARAVCVLYDGPPGFTGQFEPGHTWELSSVCGCYANCDTATIPPILNVNDFVCFLMKFAAGDPYANCDNSTLAPILNVNDFACFVNAFAAGCP